MQFHSSDSVIFFPPPSQHDIYSTVTDLLSSDSDRKTGHSWERVQPNPGRSLKKICPTVALTWDWDKLPNLRVGRLVDWNAVISWKSGINTVCAGAVLWMNQWQGNVFMTEVWDPLVYTKCSILNLKINNPVITFRITCDSTSCLH